MFTIRLIVKASTLIVAIALAFASALALANNNPPVDSCTADQSIAGSAAGGTQVTNDLVAQFLYNGSVSQSVYAGQLNYSAANACFQPNAATTPNFSTAVFQNVLGVMSSVTGSGSSTTLHLYLSGTLPGAAYTVLLHFMSAQAPGIAVLNQCAASARLAMSFPTKYIFLTVINQTGATHPASVVNGLDGTQAYSFLNPNSFGSKFNFSNVMTPGGSALNQLDISLDLGASINCGHSLRQP